MEQTDKERTYIGILSRSLEKKSKLLEEIILLTIEQGNILLESFDEDKFNQILDAKEEILVEMQQLDDGFESVYEQVRTALISQSTVYREEIMQMQNLIRHLTDQSTKLQVLELQNKEKFQMYIQKQRGRIKEFNKNNRTMKSYYDMANQQKQESIFFDKKN